MLIPALTLALLSAGALVLGLGMAVSAEPNPGHGPQGGAGLV